MKRYVARRSAAIKICRGKPAYTPAYEDDGLTTTTSSVANKGTSTNICRSSGTRSSVNRTPINRRGVRIERTARNGGSAPSSHKECPAHIRSIVDERAVEDLGVHRGNCTTVYHGSVLHKRAGNNGRLSRVNRPTIIGSVVVKGTGVNIGFGRDNGTATSLAAIESSVIHKVGSGRLNRNFRHNSSARSCGGFVVAKGG